MSIEIKDLDGGTGNIISGSGVLTGEQYLTMLEAHLSQDKEKFQKYKYSLCDFTKVTEVDIPTSTIEYATRLCKKAAEINPDPVIALAAEKDVVFGLSRMWEILSEGSDWEVMVFRSRPKAVAWIKERVKEKYGLENLTFS